MPWDLMIISFAREQQNVVSKDDCLSMKLQSTPNDVQNITYKLKTYAFGEGSPECWLEHIWTFQKIIASQNITTGPPTLRC